MHKENDQNREGRTPKGNRETAPQEGRERNRDTEGEREREQRDRDKGRRGRDREQKASFRMSLKPDVGPWVALHLSHMIAIIWMPVPEWWDGFLVAWTGWSTD